MCSSTACTTGATPTPAGALDLGHDLEQVADAAERLPGHTGGVGPGEGSVGRIPRSCATSLTLPTDVSPTPRWAC